MKRMDKKGQQMALGTIIAIVLGIVVLIFLIYGFSTGWSNLWSKVTGSVSSSNVQDRIKDCETDCLAGEKSSFCFEKKELRFFDEGGKVVKVSGTCVDFANSTFAVEKKVTAGQIKEMGFEECSAIDCKEG
jgi:hypothetical protein